MEVVSVGWLWMSKWDLVEGHLLVTERAESRFSSYDRVFEV
jgi:hypothetical protein